ncbi:MULTISPECIES: GntR family transcriptional regulator [unclassified Microbacterium]|uniref:GntR family transcriptional regulator n=1 Tax=Microbacterium TaxID=33882 RepID=UPI003BA37F4A
MTPLAAASDAIALLAPLDDVSTKVPRGALPEVIYHRIRHAIITGVYPAGMRLNEQRLAETLEVSRVPLRESFHRLERDGFISQEPRRSAVVTAWDRRRVDELFDTRIGIEVEAVQTATRRIAQGQSTRELELLVAHSRDALHRGDALGIATSSTEFHRLIVAAAGNELMMSFMDQLAPRMIWLFYLTSVRDAEQACAEHDELIEVMASGNIGLARSVAHAHIERGRAPSLAAMQL